MKEIIDGSGLGEFNAALDIEFTGGEDGDLGDAFEDFGDPKRGHALFKEAVAEIDQLLLL